MAKKSQCKLVFAINKSVLTSFGVIFDGKNIKTKFEVELGG